GWGGGGGGAGGGGGGAGGGGGGKRAGGAAPGCPRRPEPASTAAAARATTRTAATSTRRGADRGPAAGGLPTQAGTPGGRRLPGAGRPQMLSLIRSLRYGLGTLVIFAKACWTSSFRPSVIAARPRRGQPTPRWSPRGPALARRADAPRHARFDHGPGSGRCRGSRRPLRPADPAS